MLYVLVALIALGGWLYVLVEVLTTDEADVRSLSKFTWILIVLLTFWIGAILWSLSGRPRLRAARMTIPISCRTSTVACAATTRR
jgi:lysylphosphatidylglycerol synthetase-like protein (DUF2156 family)